MKREMIDATIMLSENKMIDLELTKGEVDFLITTCERIRDTKTNDKSIQSTVIDKVKQYIPKEYETSDWELMTIYLPLDIEKCSMGYYIFKFHKTITITCTFCNHDQIV